MLNKFGPSGHGEAQVQYLDGDFRVISPGTYVRCAVTDARIPLDELKYWSVDLQEAYAIPSAVLQRHFPAALKKQAKAVSVPIESECRLSFFIWRVFFTRTSIHFTRKRPHSLFVAFI